MVKLNETCHELNKDRRVLDYYQLYFKLGKQKPTSKHSLPTSISIKKKYDNRNTRLISHTGEETLPPLVDAICFALPFVHVMPL
jgi:hypothetical protein